MSIYEFKCEGKIYSIESEKCAELINDEENPVEGFDVEEAFRLLNESDEIEFMPEYYQEACPECLDGVKEKQKFFKFFETHYYIFTKDGKYIISDIDKNYKGQSFNKLTASGKVNGSYIVSFIVCANCMDYIIQIESCEV